MSLKHSMAISCESTLMAHTMKWDCRQAIEKLALSALLHDIRKKALPPKLLTKQKAKMTFEKIPLYEEHPDIC